MSSTVYFILVFAFCLLPLVSCTCLLSGEGTVDSKSTWRERVRPRVRNNKEPDRRMRGIKLLPSSPPHPSPHFFLAHPMRARFLARLLELPAWKMERKRLLRKLLLRLAGWDRGVYLHLHAPLVRKLKSCRISHFTSILNTLIHWTQNNLNASVMTRFYGQKINSSSCCVNALSCHQLP